MPFLECTVGLAVGGAVKVGLAALNPAYRPDLCNKAPRNPSGISPKQLSRDVKVSSSDKKRGLDEQEKSFMDKIKEFLGV